MTHDPQHVIEIILDELARALNLSPVLVDLCRLRIAELLRPRRPALFLATGDTPPCDATIEAVRAMTSLGIDAHLARSHSFAQAWPVDVLRTRLDAVTLLDDLPSGDIRQLPDRFPLLCILTLSDNSVVKTVLGLRDALPPLVIRAFLERGRPVVVAGTPPPRLAFDRDASLFWGLPQPMRQWLAEGYRTLEQWGVEFVAAEQLAEAVCRRVFDVAARGTPPAQPDVPATPARTPASPPSSTTVRRVFLTVDDVRAARARGERRIDVAPNVMVTDEARDFAARWGILLID
jgi:hypothetical protein